MFEFHVSKTVDRARAGEFSTAHGTVHTPIFMPVGTQATVKALDAVDVDRTSAEIMLSNTYHLYLRPGHEVVAEAGGVHAFMNWNKPVLTDSGGFQVLSLGDQMEAKTPGQRASVVSDDGVKFNSHIDGSEHFFTPELSIQVQQALGSDIMMVLDDVVGDSVGLDRTREAVERSKHWAARCITEWEKRGRASLHGSYQALFGIVQGAQYEELRKDSLAWIVSQPFDGIALGGESIGYSMEATEKILAWLKPVLPPEKPLYCMGLGRDPQNVIDAVRWGVDMFDCVGPSRLARNGVLFSGTLSGDPHKPDSWLYDSEFAQGRLQIGQSKWKHHHQPIDSSCSCYTCTNGYTVSYLYHLFKAHELLYFRLATMHNISTMNSLVSRMRSWILEA